MLTETIKIYQEKVVGLKKIQSWYCHILYLKSTNCCMMNFFKFLISTIFSILYMPFYCKNTFINEQNGFMKNRSSIDHIITLTSIIETRKTYKLSTYVPFIDFRKAHDSINRVSLFNKLENLVLAQVYAFSQSSILECIM